MKKKCKTIFFVTQLDLQKAGNQTLLSTIRGYLLHGYKVLLFTSNKASDKNITNYSEIFGKRSKDIILYRFNTFYREFYQFFKKAYVKKRANDNEVKNILKIEETVTFHNFSLKLTLLGLAQQISFFINGFFKLIKLVRKYKPVVIYGYEIFGAPLAWSVAKITKTPIVTRFQGTIAYPVLIKYKSKSWLKIPHHLIGLKIPSDLIIMGNDGTHGKEVLLRLGIQEEKIRFLINGVDKTIFIPDFNRKKFLKSLGLRFENNTKIILTCSILEKWKRVDRAIIAMSKIVKIDSNVKLIIVGSGSDKSRLEKLVKYFNLENNVVFMGAIPHNKIKYYINASDLLFSLYDHSNLCNPVLEALECGKCVISIDDGSTKGILINNENSILIKKYELSNKLPIETFKLLNDKKLYGKIGNKAKKFANEYLLSWEERMDLEVKEVEKIL